MGVRIVIADRCQVVLEGIKTFLSKYPDLKVVGEATEGIESVHQVNRLKPDIVIIDLFMPDIGPFELLSRMREISPQPHVVVFTTHAAIETVARLLSSGISGHVLKEGPLSELVCAIKAVTEGGNYYSAVLSPGTPAGTGEAFGCIGYEIGFEGLSKRESEVFPLVAEGKTMKEIALQLGISPKTVDSHKRRIMFKLEARTSTDLTKIAIRRNLISA
jgi:DNA-binding NarL/FixJ family response regulator